MAGHGSCAVRSHSRPENLGVRQVRFWPRRACRLHEGRTPVSRKRLLHVLVAAVVALAFLPGCVFRFATPDKDALRAKYRDDDAAYRREYLRLRRIRGIVATSVGPVEIGAAGAAIAAVASGAGSDKEQKEHAPEDRWQGPAEDAGEQAVGYIFLVMAAAYLLVSGIGDTACGIRDLTTDTECEFFFEGEQPPERHASKRAGAGYGD